MKWEDVSGGARFTMKMLGDFSPTANPAHLMVKGCIYAEDPYDDCRVYWDNRDLRSMASHLIEVAEWLEKRAGVDKEIVLDDSLHRVLTNLIDGNNAKLIAAAKAYLSTSPKPENNPT